MIKERDVSTIHLISLLRFLNYFDRTWKILKTKSSLKLFHKVLAPALIFRKAEDPLFSSFQKKKVENLRHLY